MSLEMAFVGCYKLFFFDDPVIVCIDFLKNALQLFLIAAGVELASDVGQHHSFEFVFELHYLQAYVEVFKVL